MKYKIIVLDFDGVIVDSVGVKDRAFEMLFAQYTDYIDDIMQYHLSHNAIIRYEKFEYIYTHILKEEYTLVIKDDLSKRYGDFVFSSIVNGPFVDGAINFLEYFSKQCPLYLASINPLDELMRIVQSKKLDHFFQDIYAVPWKKKDALKDIAQKNNCSIRDLVFIGDSPEDYQVAVEANVDFIGRDSGKQFPQKMHVFKDMTAIQQYLLS